MNYVTTRAGAVERLGALSYRRRWSVLALAFAALVALWAVAGSAGGEFAQSSALPGTETQAAADRLAAAGFPGGGAFSWGAVVVAAERGVGASAVQEPVAAFLARVERIEGMRVESPYRDGAAHRVSPDGRIAYATLHFGDAEASAAARAEQIRALRDAVSLPAGVRLELGGDLFVEEAPFSSEALGLMAAAVILLVAFGSLLAMGLPLATALVGIACGVAVVTLAARWFAIPPFAPAAVVMIGIGVGVDYALFVVTRYREELARGLAPARAVGRAMATAGRATVFAGATTVTSLLGLFVVVGIDDVRSLALAIAAGVLFVMLASVTLLPALLGVAGRHIDRFGLPHRHRPGAGNVEHSAWYRWSRFVQRRPLPLALASLLVLVLLAAPVASLRLGLADASTRPESDTSRRAYDLLAEGFGEGFSGPLALAVALPGSAEATALDGLVESLRRTEGVAHVAPPVLNDASDTAFIQVIADTAPQDPATAGLVRELRDGVLPAALAGTGAEALVGGVAAAGIDFAAYNARVLPWFIAVVLALAFALLMVLFRSVLVPLKAVAVNLLSVGAAYGVVVAVFQWGWLGGVLGLGEPGPIEAWVPMMLFAIVFGLSIDYEVFLLSRIRERYEATGDNSRAVADGLARTARLISAAAAIMVCVFGAFALSADRALQMLGLGLAVAIAVDVTLVRLVLVPATMELAGERNWWLPRFLERILPGGRAWSAEPAPSGAPGSAGS